MREQALFEPGDEHHVELEALGGVRGHHLQRISAFAGLVLAGFERGVRQERGQRRGLGLRVGNTVFKRDQADLAKVLHKAMSCEPTDHREGGSHTRCATPPVQGATYLRGGIEYDCSAWISIGPNRPCGNNEAAKEFVEVRVSRD